jgi:hypothetical protein
MELEEGVSNHDRYQYVMGNECRSQEARCRSDNVKEGRPGVCGRGWEVEELVPEPKYAQVS